MTANNALLYPGLGLGTIVSGASKVTDGVATRKVGNAVQAVQDAMWQPVYSDAVA